MDMRTSSPHKKARILALDLAKTTGFAVIDYVDDDFPWEAKPDIPALVLASGAITFEGEGTAERMAQLKGIIEELHRDLRFDIVVAEAPNIMPGQSMEGRRMAFGLSVTAELWCLENGQQLKLVSTSSLKSTAAKILGEKTLPKSKGQAMRAASEYANKAVVNNDEADAIVVGLWAVGEVSI